MDLGSKKLCLNQGLSQYGSSQQGNKVQVMEMDKGARRVSPGDTMVQEWAEEK